MTQQTNESDNETAPFSPADNLSTRFKKVVARTVARLSGRPITINMLSTIRMKNTRDPVLINQPTAVRIHDTRGPLPPGEEAYVAYHTKADTWNLYLVYRMLPPPEAEHPPIKVHKAVGFGLSPDEVLDLIAERSAEAMTTHAKKYNHPVRVAKMIGHAFKPVAFNYKKRIEPPPWLLRGSSYPGP